jgi:hypothetical protein
MARLNETDLSERLFLKGYPFKRYAPRPDGPVTTAITPLRKPRAECTVLLEGQCCNGIVSGCWACGCSYSGYG